MKVLQDKRSTAAKALRDMLDLAKSEERGLTAEEKTKHQAMVEEINGIDDLMKREKEAQEIEARDNELEDRQMAIPNAAGKEDRKDADVQEFRAFMEGKMKEYSKEQRDSMSSTVGSEGGYMVPTLLYNQLLEYLEDDNAVRKLATKEAWEGDGSFPVVTSFGTCYLVSEGSEVTTSKPVLGSHDVTGYQLMYNVDVPKKLINNSKYPVEQKLMGWYGKARGNKEEDLFMTGTGSGQPTGLLATSANGGPIEGTRTASNSALAGDDIVKWFYDVPKGYRKRSSWIFNDAVIRLIREIKNEVETNGAKQYLWLPGLLPGEPDTLLGRPIYASDGCPSEFSADEKLGVFGDISQFVIVDFARPEMLRDPYSRSTFGEIRFVGWQLIDTALPVQEAIISCRTAQ